MGRGKRNGKLSSAVGQAREAALLKLSLAESRLVLDILREELDLIEPPYVPTSAHLNFITRTGDEGVEWWGFEAFRVPTADGRGDTRSPVTLQPDLSLTCHAEVEAKHGPALERARARLRLLAQARQAADFVVAPGARKRPSVLAERLTG